MIGIFAVNLNPCHTLLQRPALLQAQRTAFPRQNQWPGIHGFSSCLAFSGALMSPVTLPRPFLSSPRGQVKSISTTASEKFAFVEGHLVVILHCPACEHGLLWKVWKFYTLIQLTETFTRKTDKWGLMCCYSTDKQIPHNKHWNNKQPKRRPTFMQIKGRSRGAASILCAYTLFCWW